LIMPSRGINMGDGWETKRNRTPNNRDWVVLQLATTGTINKILVDTCHFKGNYPDRCSVEGCLLTENSDPLAENVQWISILPEQKLSADSEHEFEAEISNKGLFSHIRLNIFPDGGISRLRLWGNKK